MTCGGSASYTVTLKAQLTTLLLASLALQFTVVTPFASRLPGGGTQSTRAPGQLSVTCAAYCTTASHLPDAVYTIMLAGHTNTGRSLSETVTLNVHVAVLPLLSFAVQITFVSPTENRVPDGGTQLNVASPQLSLPVGTKLTTASHRPDSHDTLISPGQLICGFSPSNTSTINEHRFWFLFASIATHSTIVCPTPNNDPLAGVQITRSIAQLSVACTS